MELFLQKSVETLGKVERRCNASWSQEFGWKLIESAEEQGRETGQKNAIKIEARPGFEPESFACRATTFYEPRSHGVPYNMVQNFEKSGI